MSLRLLTIPCLFFLIFQLTGRSERTPDETWQPL